MPNPIDPTPFAPGAPRNRRILVIDDNIAIHEDVRKILCPQVDSSLEAISALEAELLGEPASGRVEPTLCFDVDSALQGREGLAKVERAIAENRPYAMAFVDVRMPPGWDGVETTLQLWKVQPDLQIVICTAYSDYSWGEMLRRLGTSDRLVVLRKPFDTIEVLQLANSLTEKWNLVQETRRYEQELEERVRKRTADLEAANAALQAEISRRVQIEADLVRAKDAAESADRAKSSFLANMSHEIRTPMNGVVGMANLLLSTELNSEQSDYVQTLSQCCDSLLTIINDILDFSKIEAGRLELEDIEFDLADTVQLAIDLHAAAAEKKSLELVLQVDPSVPLFVRGDPTRLRQVVLNLVGNAVKFTPSGEVLVHVSATGSNAGRTQLRFEIVDTGIGIATDVQSGLFRPFVQEDSSTTRRFGGTGLGLAISKRLIEMMRGEIGLTSSPGKGSTFWFTVELEPAAETNASITFLPLPIKGRRVLAVDDCAASRRLLEQLLGQWGAKPESVADGATALQSLQKASAAGAPYALVLIDQNMTGMNGTALAAAIRTDRGIVQPALVLLTRRADRLNATQLAAIAIDACEAKPIHAEKLRTTLGHVFTRPRSADTSRKNESKSASAQESAPILVAEDNPANQKVIQLTLRNLGYSCHIVANGREALAALREREFSLVLMDEHMPEMDGLEATRRIRAESSAGTLRCGKELVIIATTADAMSGTRERCLHAGMDDYLPKPIRVDLLAAMLNFHLKRQAAASPMARAAGH